MIGSLAASGFAGLVATAIIGTAMLSTRRLWAGRSYLGIAYGLVGFAAVSHLIFLAVWLAPSLGMVLSFVVVGGCLLYLGASGVWRTWRAILPLGLCVAGLLMLYLAMLYLWLSPLGTFSLAAWRFTSGGLPVDNYLPALFADRLAAGRSTHELIGDWNGSDRPPLQSGFLLLVNSVVGPAGGSTAQFGASVIAQMLWLPALFALSRSVGVSKFRSLLAVVFVGVLGTTLLNTLFTWPKMLSAALVLVACVFLIDAVRRPEAFRTDFVLAVASFAFAMLAHGAAGFSLPMVIWLGVLAYRRQTVRRAVGWTMAAALTGILIYTPWFLFQRIADPPGDRLLKWHLAGAIAPDPRSFLEVLVAAYSALSPNEWLAGRWANLQTVFEPNPLAGFGCWCMDSIDARRLEEFYITTIALGLGYPLLIVAVLGMLVQTARTRTLSLGDRWLLVLVGGATASVLFWCVLMYLPGSSIVHQGSHVWILLLGVVGFTWIARRWRVASIVLLCVQAALMLVVYIPMTDSAQVNPAAILVGLLGTVIVVAGLIVSHRFGGARPTIGIRSIAIAS